MFYTKNVPGWERALRIVIGMLGLGLAYASWGTSNIAVGLGFAGVMLAMTGLVGFCPMCAMVGRRIGSNH